MGIIDGDMDMDDLKYEIEEEARTGTRIKVIGVGGGGCNAVARMVAEGLEGVEFYAMNTDLQALAACQVPNKLQLGAKMTKGLGAGSNPRSAARRRSKTPTASSRCCRARTWCSSPRDWAAAPAPARRR